MSSVALADDGEGVKPAAVSTSEKLPDPTLWQRLVSVVAGVVAFSVVVSLGMILIESRVAPPFSWIPGLAILLAGSFSFAIGRVMVLGAFDVNDGNLEMAKPLRWLAGFAVGIVALASMGALYTFLLMGTPMYKLQGDHGIQVVEVQAQEAAGEYSEADWAWGQRGAELSERFAAAQDLVLGADGLVGLRSALSVATPEMEVVAAEFDAMDWPAEYAPEKRYFVGGMTLIVGAYGDMAEAIDAGDGPAFEEALRRAEYATNEVLMPAVESLYNN